MKDSGANDEVTRGAKIVADDLAMNDGEFVREAFLRLTERYIRCGAAPCDLQYVSATTTTTTTTVGAKSERVYTRTAAFLACLVVVAFLYVAPGRYLSSGVTRDLRATRCLLPSNFLVWEFTRPISNCDYCRGVDSPLILRNVTTRDEFRPYSYSSRPMIVKEAARGWPARRTFSLRYFRELYERTDGAYESVEEECQFLHFTSGFADLREVLAMSERRAAHRDGEESWYVGWKNCHPRIVEAMTRHYSPPHFLPDDAEVPYSNYVFLGYGEGAVMHLDYISRLMWQAQVIGSKTWTVAPTPECENQCGSFEFTVHATDVVLLDTRIWYHGTRVENGRLSLTVTSEYG